MGMDSHSLHFLRYARAQYGALGKVITLGRIGNFLGPRASQKWVDSADTENRFCEAMLKQHFGATIVDSIDNSAYEGATIISDMNQSIATQLIGQYDCVLDFGCTEHIFDVAQCFRNVMALCKPGGVILHCVPTNGFCGHGFYQFSPELFFTLYSESNGFEQTQVYVAELDDTNHWYRVSPPVNGARINLWSPGQMHVFAITRKKVIREISMQQSDYMYEWKNASPDAPALNRHGRSAKIKELCSRVRLIARCRTALDARFSPHGPKKPHQHPALTRIPIERS